MLHPNAARKHAPKPTQTYALSPAPPNHHVPCLCPPPPLPHIPLHPPTHPPLAPPPLPAPLTPLNLRTATTYIDRVPRPHTPFSAPALLIHATIALLKLTQHPWPCMSSKSRCFVKTNVWVGGRRPASICSPAQPPRTAASPPPACPSHVVLCGQCRGLIMLACVA